MPVITGLYTLPLPIVAFAAFGSSRYLVVASDSATAAILAGGLTGLAAAGSPDYASLAGLVALLTAVLLLLGISAANAAAALTGTFVVATSRASAFRQDFSKHFETVSS